MLNSTLHQACQVVIYTILEISSAGKLTIIILSKNQYGCEIEFYSIKQNLTVFLDFPHKFTIQSSDFLYT